MSRLPRLYVPGRLAAGPLALDSGQSHRLGAVMRLDDGDPFLVFNGDGHEWSATVTASTRGTVHATVAGLARQAPPPALSLEVWVGLVRPNRFDWAIEKCVEAGADVIRPLLTGRAARGEGASDARQERWSRVVVEAAEQCGRLHLAVVAPPASFEPLLAHLRVPLFIAEAGGRPWPEVVPLLPVSGTVAVAIGPEGGFTAEELAAATARGAVTASFGANTLRTETAAVVATALVRASRR